MMPASVGVNWPVRMPAHNDDRNHQRHRGFFGRRGEFAQRGALAPDADRSEKVAIDHQPDADENARHHTSEEQAADRDIPGCTVNHRHDAGRDQVRHRGRRCDQCGSEALVVAFAIHLRGDRAGENGDVRGRRSGDAGEEHAEKSDNLCQAAAQMPHKRLGQRDHAHGHFGRGHQIPDQEEERHGEQRLDVHAVEQLRNHRGLADWREHRHRQHRGHQRESNGQARCCGDTTEDAVDEEGHRRLLHP
jgi:hypothetical protein